MVFLPLRSALALTIFIQRNCPPLVRQFPKYLAFACSFNYEKVLLVEVSTGEVAAWPVADRRQPPLERASPKSSEPDGLLRWAEEYANRLDAGIYQARPLRPEQPSETMGICLVPAIGGEVTRCVTRGVEVTTSWVYMPEHMMGWTYSISLQLVEDKATRGFDTCQLVTRHWAISIEGQGTEHVQGEGVIGLFPTLCDGGWVLNRASDPHGIYGSRGRGVQHMEGAFRYQSCLGREASQVTFGGHITFVPGTRRKPTGPPFQVRVERFVLSVPDFVY